MRMSKSEKKANAAKCIEYLRETFKEGDTAWTICKSVSSSGMSRQITIIASGKDGPRNVSYNVAMALGWRLTKDRDAVVVSGCGMDMGFHLVYSLGSVLFGDGYKLNQRWL